jgi:hypothetical protein
MNTAGSLAFTWAATYLVQVTPTTASFTTVSNSAVPPCPPLRARILRCNRADFDLRHPQPKNPFQGFLCNMLLVFCNVLLGIAPGHPMVRSHPSNTLQNVSNTFFNVPCNGGPR